jgi:hypothetical protein
LNPLLSFLDLRAPQVCESSDVHPCSSRIDIKFLSDLYFSGIITTRLSWPSRHHTVSKEEPMKTMILTAFIILAIVVGVYVFTSLRNVSRERMDPKDMPRATFEVTKWVSDANGAAYILDDPAEATPIIVNAGLGKKEAMGLREPHEYLDKVGALIQVQRLQNKKTGNPIGYIIAPARLEIEAGYNILKQSVMVSIRDPEDSHHRRQREGGN